MLATGIDVVALRALSSSSLRDNDYCDALVLLPIVIRALDTTSQYSAGCCCIKYLLKAKDGRGTKAKLLLLLSLACCGFALYGLMNGFVHQDNREIDSIVKV